MAVGFLQHEYEKGVVVIHGYTIVWTKSRVLNVFKQTVTQLGKLMCPRYLGRFKTPHRNAKVEAMHEAKAGFPNARVKEVLDQGIAHLKFLDVILF